MGVFRDIAERIGKIIPNEVSKLNSYSKYIPPPFNLIPETIAGLDRTATAYGDTGDPQIAMQAGMSGIGRSQDPGIYGGGGYARGGKPNRDWANVGGQIGNYLPGYNFGPEGGYSGGGFDWGSAPSMYGGPMGMASSFANNEYILGPRGESSTIDSMRSGLNAYGSAFGGGGMQTGQSSLVLPEPSTRRRGNNDYLDSIMQMMSRRRA